MEPTQIPPKPAQGATKVAPLGPRCPACRIPLIPSTCTVGAVVTCPSCQQAVSLALKVGAAGGPHTLEVYVSPKLPQELPGELAQRFEVVSRLGAGGQGEVLRVRPRGATRDYALKWTRVEPSASGVDRGPREAHYAALPPHPNVLAPIQIGAHQNLQYVVFDLIEGETLAAVLKREGPLPAERAVDLAHQLLRALAHVHRHGVIHRDVKPANLLIDRAGTMRLTDFGVALKVGDPPTDEIIGTPPYMSPEQVSLDALTPASDVYAAGCVLFELLTGQLPFVRENLIEMLTARLSEPPPLVTDLVPGCPEPLAAFVARCLKRGPDERPADGERALSELAVAQRACGLAEHLDLPVLAGKTERELAIERRRALGRIQRPFGAILGSSLAYCLAVFLAMSWAPTLAIWLSFGASYVLLAYGLRGLSAEMLGHPDAWWQTYLTGEPLDLADLSGVMTIGAAAFGVGLATIVALVLSTAQALLFGVWFAILILGLRPFIAGFFEFTNPTAVSHAEPVLRILVPGDDWFCRVLPAGQEQRLGHRLSLVEGPNRLEVWRHGGKRRVFLIWASAGTQTELKLTEAKDGPLAVASAPPALPAGRT